MLSVTMDVHNVNFIDVILIYSDNCKRNRNSLHFDRNSNFPSIITMNIVKDTTEWISNISNKSTVANSKSHSHTQVIL